MAEISQRLAALSPEKLALLQRRLRSRSAAPRPERSAIRRRQERGPAPLSFAQERLWFIQQLQPASPAYNIPAELSVSGRLWFGLVERALQQVVQRHEALRTRFEARDGQPVQVVAAEAAGQVPVFDLGALPETAQAAELARLAAEQALPPFRLDRLPLLRLWLIGLGSRDGVPQQKLLLTIHHIVFDAWSLGLFWRELLGAYDALAGGGLPLPPLPVQYADFVSWQRDRLQGEALEELLGYWRRRLSGAPAVLDLPTDRPRPAVAGFRGGFEPIVLPVWVHGALKAFAQRERTSLFMLLLASFAVLLHRVTGGEDLLIGTPVAHRGRRELEELIGYFLNILVIRTDLRGDPSFQELLARVRDTVLDDFAHQDLPLDKLVQELRPGRSPGANPLFQAMFVLQTAEGRAADGGTEASLHVPVGTTRFDLGLSLVEAAGISGGFEYSADLFDATTVRRLAGHFAMLLEGIAADPDRRLSELPLLTPPERQLRREWNDTSVPYPAGLCLHELFEARAAAAPDVVALTFEEEAVSFAALDARANFLAHRLRELGVGPEVRVGLLLGRSPDMVASVLATLKAGGAYVALDPSYPEERLAFLMEDAEIEVLVVQSHLQPLLPPHGARVLRVDHEGIGTSPEPPASGAGVENTAYVIYTSGSTGRPKGVVVAHGSAVNAAELEIRTWRTGAEDRFLQAASLSFDASLSEMLTCFAGGACLCLPRQEDLVPGPDLLRLLRDQRVTGMALTVSVLSALPVEALPDLRLLVAFGEACPAELVTRWRAVPRFFNAYGPTEASMWMAGTDVAPGSGPPPIGRPLANARMHLLDRRLGEVPIGVSGELYLGGLPVTRGYLKRPDLTAERFVPDPFGAPGERLYRTGDLARYLPDGRIDFLGRIDQQVKIRGFRVEIGEVEAALAAHPQVRQAVVAAREDLPGGRGLVAYLTPLPGPALAAAELRRFAQERLPDYMIPAVFVVLPELPLTSTGKVDRRALPAPDAAKIEPDTPYVPPADATEETLARIWSEVLGIERVGVEDDFFALGGHSLLAVQITSRVRDALGTDVPIRLLFEELTVRGLAARLAGTAGRPVSDRPLGPATKGQSGTYPLSFAQERLWFLDRLEPGTSAYNIPGAFFWPGALHVPALAASFREIVRRHAALRTTFDLHEGRPVQVVAATSAFRLPLVDLAALPEQAAAAELQLLALAEAMTPFDLGRGPLLRVVQVRSRPDAHGLLLTMHHIVSDAWSIQVLLRELSALYNAYVQGRPSPLPELPIQYPDFALWQRDWLQGEVLAQQLDYWKRHLAGAPAVLDLPFDRPRPPVWTYRGATQLFTLSRELLHQVKSFGQRRGATPFMILLAVFQALLWRITHQERIPVGTPAANRSRSELEHLIGFFVNTLVLVTDFSTDRDLHELVDQVREVALGAYAHEHLPFEKLVEELRPERSRSANPLFQVMFRFDVPMSLPAEELAPGDGTPPILASASKFDLTLSLSETKHGLSGAIEYSVDLFDHTTIARLASQLGTMLAGVLAAPDRRLSEAPLLPAAERQALREWNATEAALPAGATLVDLLRRQAEATPEATAVIFGSERLSYREVHRRARRLARRLQALGVGPEVRVGISLERSPELIVALLAVWEAAGAYVPLDPEYPPARLAFMLEDARPRVLLASGPSAELTAELPAGAHLLDLQKERPWEEPEDAGEPPMTPAPDELAYTIYTSGSTGRPKGAMNSHGAILNRILWMQRAYGLGAADRVLQKTPASFDVSVWEFFWPLAVGAGLVLAAPGGHRDTGYLVRAIVEAEVTTLHFVPSMLRAFLDDPRVGACTSIRRVIASGEALPAELERRLHALLPWARLDNLYGPTEAAVDVTAWACDPGEARRAVPIGRPVDNTQIHLLDARLGPVPRGVAGEVCIGGVQVGRGYLDRPDLTAERFLPDPFASTPGARMYRTGDLARRLPGGEIEFLRRIDQQIKIRGFRVELGEIEAVLAEHPAVAEAVAVVRERLDGPAGERIAAYVVGAGAQMPPAAELRAWLESRLPSHMVPSALIELPALPLTPSGKLDRRALPEPSLERAELGVPFVAPRGPLETVVAGLWAEVLGLDEVGATDNFFALGGHSLLAVQVASRLRDTFGIDVPVRQFFDTPDVAGLAEALRRDPREGDRVERAARTLARLAQMSDLEIERELAERRNAPGQEMSAP